MRSLIFHVDVNSAFLSWESAKRLRDNPDALDLRTINAVIGGDEKMRHGVVLAKSPSAKKYGIMTGEPLSHARQKCPELVVVPPDHELYAASSRKFIEILEEVAPVIEQCSIDEAFCDMTGTEKLYGDPIAFATKLKDRIYKELGFTVNIGISTNKLLAKMASDFEKPNRVHTLFPEEMAAKFWPLPVESLYGCGKTTAKRLRSLGITTIGALAKADRQMLLSNFKSQGDYLWESANGISSSAVTAESPANKGYGNSVTLPYDVTDTENAHHILLSLCETVGARIRYDKAYISVVQVQIVDNDFHHRCKQLSLPSATNVTEKIYEAACKAFDQGWDHAPIRLLGVSTSKATDESYEQYNLFDQDKFERLSKLNSAIDKIRDKYGDDAIVRACFAETPKN
ncbi:DNA polymerase Y family protein [Roseburia inulinivorans]|uniref:DNA polymerase Y family protein n=1 Tax=Roseburia inulinivorans TaxID=360807 RepID=UPI0032C106BD